MLRNGAGFLGGCHGALDEMPPRDSELEHAVLKTASEAPTSLSSSPLHTHTHKHTDANCWGTSQISPRSANHVSKTSRYFDAARPRQLYAVEVRSGCI